MKDKEIGELRRRLRPEKHNITHIRGCYVSEQKEMLSCFDQSLGLMPQEESEKYLALFKRVLSGPLGKNLMDLTFTTTQVMDSEEHKLLTALKDSSLKDEDAVQAFFTKVTEGLTMEGNYLILLARDAYDVPYRAKDGLRLDDSSSNQFSYILCAVCPVKLSKPALSYFSEESLFHNRKLDWTVSAPELGFLFPAFDDRATNLYNALYYSHDIAACHEDFIETVFRTPLPMPAAAQKQTFQSILGSTLEDDCKFDLVQTVHGQLCDMIEAHKADKEAEPLVVTKREVQSVLESCGVGESRVAAFSVQYDTEFGSGTELNPRNIVDAGQFEVRTPDVVIRVKPEKRDLIETRVIGGLKYILICADDGVEVNGVGVHIGD